MPTTDSLNFKQVAALLSITVLPISYFLPRGIIGVGSNKVSSCRSFFLYAPFEGLIKLLERFTDHDELAGLVLAQVIRCLPPFSVYLADGCIAELHFYLLFAGNPTFISTKSSLLTASTSSGAAPSNIRIKQEENPFVISESLSTLNLITRPTSILTSSHTWAVQPITRFASTRPDSSNSGSRPAYCSSRFTRSIGSGNDLNSQTKNSSFSATFAGLTGDSVTVKANHGSEKSGFLSVCMESEV
ncbi:hypothetical protein RJ640_016049 [Escallonia rubra]|uniref:Uncharacterized protein n=1 Tax=Escallonia rubra TaxID=112253 RepID=A0AA88RUA3_9ASTE|nr:hypothetical protein RJ640_016049 [Escallonia rubra]